MPCFCCPRQCDVDRAHHTGFCGAGLLPRVARAALHHWEEPMFSGSNGSGAVFFSGCNLKCVFCQNKEISARQKGSILDADMLADVFLRLQAQGAHNINLVTPTPHIETLKKSIQKAKSTGLSIPVLYNCGCYESINALRTLEGFIDIYLPDIKYFSPSRSLAYAGTSDYFTHAAIALEEMQRQVGTLQLNDHCIALRGLLIRHLVLPGNLDDTRSILAHIREALPKNTYLSLMRQYTPLAADLPPPLHRKLTAREYARAVDECLRLGFENVLVQDDASSSAAFVPAFFETLQ